MRTRKPYLPCYYQRKLMVVLVTYFKLAKHQQGSILNWRHFIGIQVSIYCLMFTVNHDAELHPDYPWLPSESGH